MIAILLLSALGGSFVPRVAMPQAMQTVGLIAPTTWAVGGLSTSARSRSGLDRGRSGVGGARGVAALFLAMAARLTRRRIVA
jgi:ABC-type multidrug transport system permease subunit